MFLPFYSENESEYSGKKFRASDYYHFHLILTLRHQKLREAVQISKSRITARIISSEYGKNFAAIIPATNEIITTHADPFLPHPHLLTLTAALTYNSLAFSPLYTARGNCVTLFLFPFLYVFCFVVESNIAVVARFADFARFNRGSYLAALVIYVPA